ncbi:MAG: hypothetical protein K2K60_01555 [Clostridia bacterium]|nr:hypothetical protein [Clostridia bacterium]
MSESFKKQKRKYLIKSLLESIAVGVSAGLFVVGVVLLTLKLCELNINAGFYVLIGLSCAAVGGGLTYLFSHPSDMKVARKLDEEYGLDEKIQTMVIYKDKEDFIYRLQREDASEKLAVLPKRKISFRQVWQYVVILILAIAIFIPALAIRKNSVPANGNDLVELSATECELVEQLIGDINESELSDGVKASTVSVLRNLLANLEGEHTERSRKAAVVASISFIDTSVTSENTYKKICTELIKQEPLKVVSDTVVDGITMFKADGTILSYQKVKDEAEVIPDYVFSLFNKTFVTAENSLRETLKISKDDGFAEKLTEYDTAFENALTNSESYTGGLLSSLKSFKSALGEVLEKSGQSFAEATLQNDLNAGFANFVQTFSAAVSNESYNCLMAEYIRNRLAKIFNVPLTDLPSLRYGVEGGSAGIGAPEDPNEEKKDPSGGMGEGGLIYGSDDEIYDHELGKRVKYGEVINKYYGDVLNLILEGNLSEEYATALDNYFSLLMGGVQDTEKGNDK